ncbi:unnamed protein product [Darwinula stevensoni]|uniref:Uncharacterized protein n=1 Tax=Darwinula stevensoni TaxID=69355 RepID=A0A7R9A185_9CRUS|nr:unnamed protein product [Darwinula stevensoni]CAG0886107.1 unnamed protein product [Darwinula stevensoni]
MASDPLAGEPGGLAVEVGPVWTQVVAAGWLGLVFVVSTLANLLLLVVFYRRPSLRSLSNSRVILEPRRGCDYSRHTAKGPRRFPRIRPLPLPIPKKPTPESESAPESPRWKLPRVRGEEYLGKDEDQFLGMGGGEKRGRGWGRGERSVSGG